MKKATLILFTAITFSIISFAQPGGGKGNKKEKLEALKVGFITQRLDLTTEEAQKFWPVYNQLHDELKALRKERREDRNDAKENFDSMSDADYEKMIDEEMARQQKELDIRKKYHAELKKVLPIKKLAQLYKAEEGFKRQLLEKIKEPGQGPGEPVGPQKH